MKIYQIFALAALFFVVSSCNKEEDDDKMTEIVYNQLETYNPIQEIVTASLLGTVLDESNSPIAEATVMHRGMQYTTDEEGVFIIRDQSFDSNGSYFTVQKDGYFVGSRKFYPQEGSTNYAYVQLLELTTIGEFEADLGGQVKGSDGIEIDFTANSIQSADGTLYSGQVSVAAKWLDPTSDNVHLTMPGDLVGLDSGGDEQSLASYGMMAVELYSADGSPLNLAPETEATLTFPIPSNLLEDAPTEIPLWSFEEEEHGIWVEEGIARLEGEKYVGEVSHFSFWNCDAPFDLINVYGQLLTESGSPIANTEVLIAAPEINTARIAFTDNKGFFRGKMPKDSELRLSIVERTVSENCNFGNETFGPFTDVVEDEVNLGQIELQSEQSVFFNLSLTVIDCESDPVGNGKVKIKVGGRTITYLPENDGTFSAGLFTCGQDESVTITVSDLDALEIGDPVEKPITPIMDCGELYACGNVICVTELFVGDYMLSLEELDGFGYGPPYSEVNVTVTTVFNSQTLRSFSTLVLPGIGGFGPYETTFDIECEQATYQKMESNGLGCGTGEITFGPAFNEDGDQITAPLDIEDDSEIILYFDPSFTDGGCPSMQELPTTKLTLTKI